MFNNYFVIVVEFNALTVSFCGFCFILLLFIVLLSLFWFALWNWFGNTCFFSFYKQQICRSAHISVLIVARVLAGLGSSAVCVAIPIYIKHLTSSKIKLRVEKSTYAAFVLGALIYYILGKYFFYIKIFFVFEIRYCLLL